MRNGAEPLEIIFAAGGATGALLRDLDWSQTPLGCPDTWPQSLWSTLSICLNARSPIAFYWGPEHILLYNDAWIAIPGKRHPWAMGRPAREVWADVWHIAGPSFARVMEHGEAISAKDELCPTWRNGYLEESYLDYTLSPIRGEGGRIAGIFSPVSETTQRVIAERRSRLLHELAEVTGRAISAEQACTLAADVLASGAQDVPFCLVYLSSNDNRLACLAAATGLEPGSQACPATVELAETGGQRGPWPLNRVLRTQRLKIVASPETLLDTPLPGGAWPEPARAIAVTPINDAGRHETLGFLVMGINPRREFDEPYRSFIETAAAGVGAAISRARAHDRERTALRTRLANIASIAPVAISELRMSPDGRLSMPYSSPAIADIYGRSPEELATDVSLATSLNHPDDRPRIEEALAASMRTLEPIREEWRVRHPAKGEIWVEVRGVPEAQPDGSVVWYGYYHDVTERKRIEETLRDREERFRQLAENIQEFFWLTDPNTCEVLYVSPAYETVWGRSRGRLYAVPSDWIEGVHIEDRQRVLEAMLHQSEGTYDVEYRVVRPDGTMRVIHDRAFPIRDESGAVYRIAGIAEDVTTQKKREKQIRFLAYHDALTRLPNRALLANRLRQAIAHAQRSGEALALMFLDVDRFKMINDTLGHPAGDLFLQQVGQRLTETLRTGDTVARPGGDEFLLLVPGLHSPEDAAPVAEHVLACLSAPFVVAGHTLRVTGSVGVSVCPRDATDAQSLIKYADAALYLAKEQGRNTFRFFSPDLDAKVRARMHLENDLRGAVDREQFVLHYQPQVELATGRIINVEALIRWSHPERGLVPPAAFIPIAEETGLILPIGEWALRAGCTQARIWQESGLCGLRVAVNLSSRQLHGADIVPTVRRILAETGCDPHLLSLEITESTVMADPKGAAATIGALHDLGIEIAIDDFGAGFSSMAHLKRFALDTLKVHAGFVQAIPANRDDITIVQAIMALARQFRLKVVAEGVETQAQKSFLEAHGCDAIQGFLISRPRPCNELQPLLRSFAVGTDEDCVCTERAATSRSAPADRASDDAHAATRHS